MASAIQCLVYRIARDKSSNQHLQRHKADPQTRKSTEERFVVLSIVCYVTNIPEVLLPWQVSQVFVAVFILINNYQQQTDSKT